MSYRTGVCTRNKSKRAFSDYFGNVSYFKPLVKEKERLIEITVDGEISQDEIPDFIAIQKELIQK